MGESNNRSRANAPTASWETRRRIFEYFKEHGAPCMRDELRRGDSSHNYVSILTSSKFNIAIYLSGTRGVWTYIYSRDPDGNLDRRILANINRNNPPAGATFHDCSNDPKRGIRSRNVCKLERDMDWRMLSDKDIETLLGDYKWLVAELRRIGVLSGGAAK